MVIYLNKIQIKGENNMATNEYSKVMGGISIAPSRLRTQNWYGTIGAIVTDNDDPNTRMILSNYHVLVADGNAQPGDAIECPSGSGQVVAHLSERWSLSAKTDAAMAVIDNRSNSVCEILGIGPVAGVANITDIEMMISSGSRVRKMGSKSGLTEGKIIANDQIAPMGYQHIKGPWKLNNQLQIEAIPPGTLFSQEGDSGSCIVDDFGRVVALLVGGDGRYSYATPIEIILNELNISICQ